MDPINSNMPGSSINTRILIVEDDASLSKSLEQVFSKEGFEVTCATDGKQALAVYKPNTYKAILLDLVIPNIDGFGVMKELRHQGNKTPIVVMSVLALDINIKEAKQLGAVEYFVKSKTPMSDIVDFVKKIATVGVVAK